MSKNDKDIGKEFNNLVACHSHWFKVICSTFQDYGAPNVIYYKICVWYYVLVCFINVI